MERHSGGKGCGGRGSVPSRAPVAGPALLAAFLALAALPRASAAQQRVVELRKCHDGDTCAFAGFEADVRLARIDAPEIDGACAGAAREARDALVGLLRSATEVVVDSVGTGRYGRVIAEVMADTVNASDWLLDRGLAVPYGQETCPDSRSLPAPADGGSEVRSRAPG